MREPGAAEGRRAHGSRRDTRHETGARGTTDNRGAGCASTSASDDRRELPRGFFFRTARVEAGQRQ